MSHKNDAVKRLVYEIEKKLEDKALFIGKKQGWMRFVLDKGGFFEVLPEKKGEVEGFFLSKEKAEKFAEIVQNYKKVNL